MPWPYPQLEPRIVHLPGDLWRCVVRRSGGEFRSLEAGQPGHATPDLALATATSRVAELLASRSESVAVESIRLLKLDRLRKIAVPDPQDPSILLQYWEAQRDNGTWASPAPTPEKATMDALNINNGGGI